MSKRIAGRYLRRLPDMSKILVKVKGRKGLCQAMWYQYDRAVIILRDPLAKIDPWDEVDLGRVSYYKKIPKNKQ